jgi:hypothetical protein
MIFPFLTLSLNAYIEIHGGLEVQEKEHYSIKYGEECREPIHIMLAKEANHSDNLSGLGDIKKNYCNFSTELNRHESMKFGVLECPLY